MRIYLDTSAFVTRFAEEPPLTKLITKIFDKCEKFNLTIVTSYWTLSEGIVAIDKAFRRGDIIKNIHEKNATISSLIGKTFTLAENQCLVLIIPNEEFISASWKYIRKDICLRMTRYMHFQPRWESAIYWWWQITTLQKG